LADGASFGRIDPAAMGFEATVSADGAKDRGCSDWSSFTLFDHRIEYGGEVCPALLHEARGLGVTVEDRTMAEAEFLQLWNAPFPKIGSGGRWPAGARDCKSYTSDGEAGKPGRVCVGACDR
jgi:hypothetical protein